MKSNWIYSRTRDNKARFLLGEKGVRSLVCIGINPSTAEPDALDNTLSTVRRFASDLGYGSWLMLNVYPQRATDPNNLHARMNPSYHRRNLRAIRAILGKGSCDIWAAWGTLIAKRDYLAGCLRDILHAIPPGKARWYTIGPRSREGHPHHPLYLSRTSKLIRFDIDGYMAEFVEPGDSFAWKRR